MIAVSLSTISTFRNAECRHPYDETPHLPVAATFSIGPDNRAALLTLDDLNDNGQGRLACERS